jgi:hypothetical protein
VISRRSPGWPSKPDGCSLDGAPLAAVPPGERTESMTRTMRLLLGAATLAAGYAAWRVLARSPRPKPERERPGEQPYGCEVDEEIALQVISLSDLDGDDHTPSTFMEELGIPTPPESGA